MNQGEIQSAYQYRVKAAILFIFADNYAAEKQLLTHGGHKTIGTEKTYTTFFPREQSVHIPFIKGKTATAAVKQKL